MYISAIATELYIIILLCQLWVLWPDGSKLRTNISLARTT